MSIYNLQVKHHSEIFASRDLAIKYINDKVVNNNLIGEPFLFLYESENIIVPNAILVFGAGNGKISVIDIADVEKHLQNVENTTNSNTKEIETIYNVLNDIKTACGLIDSSYKPNVDDEVLRKTTNIVNAIEVLSEYVQNNFKTNTLLTNNTNTVTLSKTQDENGVVLNANVNVSTYGSTDSTTINDNIVCVKEDGLYASSDLLFDEEKRTLTFITSGVKDGKYQDDARKKVINLGEHTVITPNNEEHDVKIKINKVDSYNSTISADVEISENSNNILQKKDGKLLVSGVSSNIKHQDSNVETILNENVNNINKISKELNDEVIRAVASEENLSTRINTAEVSIQNNNAYVADVEGQLFTFKNEVDVKFNEENIKIQEIIDNDVIEGVETATIAMNATKGINGKGHIIKGNVLLSNDKSIVVSEGGISANINIKVDAHNNKLYLNVGENVIEQDLPGVNLIETIVYDQKAHTIIITFSNGNVATIPVDDLLEDYTFNNMSEEPVALETTNNTDGSVNVAARLKLRSDDNLLAVENGLLYVSKTNIDNLIKTEEVRAIAAEDKLNKTINQLATDLAKNVQNNTNLINTESERAKLKENEIEGLINEHKNTTNIEFETLKNNVSIINGNISTINDGINNINVALQNVSDEIESESSRAEAVENQLYSNINNEIERAINEETVIKTTLNTNVESIAILSTKVENVEKQIDIINGTETEKGSILQIVNHSKEDILNITKNYTDTAIANKVNVDDVYSKVEVDNIVNNLHIDVINNNITTNTNNITALNQKVELYKTDLDKTDDDLQQQITLINNTHYTKSEIDAKGFLTEHQDISHLVTKEELYSNEIFNVVTLLQTTLTQLTQQVEQLQQEIDMLKSKSITDPDVAKALSALTGRDESDYMNDVVDIVEGENPIISFNIDMGEYGEE